MLFPVYTRIVHNYEKTKHGVDFVYKTILKNHFTVHINNGHLYLYQQKKK